MNFTLLDIARNLIFATGWTLVLSAVSFIGGAMLGLVLLFLRVGHVRVLQWLSRIFIEAFQGTPLLMQMFLVYFGLGLLGFELPAWMAASAALVCWSAAFLGDIWRGCVESISRGQWEASSALGMRYIQQMRYVIMPQAVRVSIAPTVGFLVQVVKATALTSILGFVELSRAGVIIANATYQPATVYGFVGLIYFILNWPLSKLSQRLERRLHDARRH